MPRREIQQQVDILLAQQIDSILLARFPLTGYGSNIRKTYILAQFLQRPDPRFEFDHTTWGVVFNDGLGLLIHFDAESILGLYNAYITFNVEEICNWERAIRMAIELMNMGIDVVNSLPPKVNWGRDGF